MLGDEPLYHVGLDLAQARDYTAIVVAEQQVYVSAASLREYPWDGVTEGWNVPSVVMARNGRWPLEHALEVDLSPWPTKPPMHIRHAERIRGKPYPEIVERVAQLLARLAPLGVTLVVDATGVGAAVVDMFRQAGLFPVPVLIHGGDAVSRDKGTWRVPKRDLVGAVQAGLQTGRLKIAPEMALSEVLVRELDTFKVTININTKHDSYAAWREADHDDLVLATALALWHRDRVWRNVDHDRLTRPVPVKEATYA